MQKTFPVNNILKALLLALSASACILFFGNVLAQVLGILFGACLLCFLLSPLSALLEKKLPRPASSVLAVALAVLLLLASIGLLAPLLARQFSDLLNMLPAALDRLSLALDRILAQIKSLAPGLSFSGQLNLDEIAGGIDIGSFGGMARSAISTVSSLTGGVYRLGLSAILACFFLTDRENLLLRLELMLPMRWRRNGVRLGKTLLRELRLYLRGQALIALSVGVLSALGLSLIGLGSGALLGLFVGACNIIPYFGPLIGGIPAVLLAVSGGWKLAAATVGVLFLVQQIDSMLLSPRIMGNITGFSPAVILLAIYLASGTGGIWGLLLAMPALMAVRTLYRVLVQSRLSECSSPVHCAE